MSWIPTEQFLAQLPRAVHGAGVIVPDRHGCILLVHDAYDPDRAASQKDMTFDWWLPGGLLEGNESPAQGAERELAEETNLWAGQMTAVGSNYESPRNEWPAVTDYYFAARALDDDQMTSIMLSPEHEGYCFAAPESVPSLVPERRRSTAVHLLAAWAAGTTCTLFNGHPLGGAK